MAIASWFCCSVREDVPANIGMRQCPFRLFADSDSDAWLVVGRWPVWCWGDRVFLHACIRHALRFLTHPVSPCSNSDLQAAKCIIPCINATPGMTFAFTVIQVLTGGHALCNPAAAIINGRTSVRANSEVEICDFPCTRLFHLRVCSLINARSSSSGVRADL